MIHRWIEIITKQKSNIPISIFSIKLSCCMRTPIICSYLIIIVRPLKTIPKRLVLFNLMPRKNPIVVLSSFSHLQGSCLVLSPSVVNYLDTTEWTNHNILTMQVIMRNTRIVHPLHFSSQLLSILSLSAIACLAIPHL